MWKLDCKESWVPKDWCFWTVVLEKTLESLLDFKEIQPVHSKRDQSWWKDWCWSWNSNTLATWCKELTHEKRLWFWERLKARGEGDDRGWDDWMASPTLWTWVWVNSESWWWTGRPGMLQSMRLQRVGHDWMNWTELNWGQSRVIHNSGRHSAHQIPLLPLNCCDSSLSLWIQKTPRRFPRCPLGGSTICWGLLNPKTKTWEQATGTFIGVMSLPLVYLGTLSHSPGPVVNGEMEVLAQHMTAEGHILFGGVFPAVHFVTLAIGGSCYGRICCWQICFAVCCERVLNAACEETEANGDNLGAGVEISKCNFLVTTDWIVFQLSFYLSQWPCISSVRDHGYPPDPEKERAVESGWCNPLKSYLCTIQFCWKSYSRF